MVFWKLYSYQNLIQSSSELQITWEWEFAKKKKKNTTHTILHSRRQQNESGGRRKEGQEGSKLQGY